MYSGGYLCTELGECTGLGMQSILMYGVDLIGSRLDFHTGLPVCKSYDVGVRLEVSFIT